MKSESGFSFAIASQPLRHAIDMDYPSLFLQNDSLGFVNVILDISKGWLAIPKLKPLSLFISLF